MANGLLNELLREKHDKEIAQLNFYRQAAFDENLPPESRQYAWDQAIKAGGAQKHLGGGSPMGTLLKGLLGIGGSGQQQQQPDQPFSRQAQTGTRTEGQPEQTAEIPETRTFINTLPPIPGVDSGDTIQRRDVQGPVVTQPSTLREVPTFETTRSMFYTPYEQNQREAARTAAITTAQQNAMEPFKIRDEQRQARATAALHDQDMEDRKAIARIQEEARIKSTHTSTVIHKPGGMPWEYVKVTVNGAGEPVGNEAAEPPAQVQNDFQAAQSMATKWKVPVLDAYNRIVGGRIEQREQEIANLKGSQAERNQRMALRSQLEKLRTDLATGGVKNATGARLALNQIRQEVSARRRDKDDPLSEMPFEQAFQYVAAEYGASPETITNLRKLSTGQAVLPPPPGGGPAPGPAPTTPAAETKVYQGYQYARDPKTRQWVRGNKVQ